MDALLDKLKEVVGRVRIVPGESGDVSIDVPGYRDGSRLYTSAERVAWELMRVFLAEADVLGLTPRELDFEIWEAAATAPNVTGG